MSETVLIPSPQSPEMQVQRDFAIDADKLERLADALDAIDFERLDSFSDPKAGTISMQAACEAGLSIQRLRAYRNGGQ